MTNDPNDAPRVSAVGFPEFWQHAHDKFSQFFDVASIELISIGNEAFKGLLSRPIDKVARHLARSVWNSLCPGMVLVLNGCGVDAMKVVRGMFESSVTLGYLHLHPELVDDYLDYNFVIQKQRNDFLREHAPEHLKRVSVTIQKEIETEFARVAPRFHDKRGKVRKNWSKTSIRGMARELGKENLYLTFYRLASSMHHGDMSGLFAQTAVVEDEDVLDVDLVPSDAWLEESLIIAHGALIGVLRDYTEIIKSETDEFVDRADKSFFEVWGKTDATASQ